MSEQPPLAERFRMPLRVGVVVAAYLGGRLLSPDRAVARLMLWAGFVILGWLIVDRATVGSSRRADGWMWARECSGMLVAGATILGLGLGGLGLYLALR